MTLLFPVLIGVYVYTLSMSIVDAPVTFSFEGIGHVAKLNPAMSADFKCTSGAGCIVFPHPCDNACIRSSSKVIMATNAEQTFATPFITMQNSHVAQSSGFYKVGLYINYITTGGDQKIGEISSPGSTDVIELVISSTDTVVGTASSKMIPTVITKMDKSTVTEFAPDDSDCPSAMVGTSNTMDTLLGPTTDASNGLYPYDSSWGATGMTAGYAVGVCTSSFYLKTNEQKVVLTWSVILALCGGALTVCMKFILHFVKACNVMWGMAFPASAAAVVPTEKAAGIERDPESA